MALSDTNAALVRMFLGYPNLYRYKNTRLEGAIVALDSASQPLVEGLIALVQNNDLLIEAAADQLGAQQVDEVKLYGSSKTESDTLDRLRTKGRLYVARISVILGAPINIDYYSTKGYPGDSFSAGGMGPENGYSASIETKLG